MTAVQRGSAPTTEPETSESGFGEPAPVFVDQSGLRGRLLRGFGWPVSVIGAILAVAMGSSLIGVQADAPAMGIPPQSSRTPVPSPTQSNPSTSTSSSSSSSSSSSPRTVARTATPGTKTPAAKTSATPSKPAAAPSKAAVTPPKPATTALRGAKPSGRPTKQP
ncbi:hypothetical protein ACFYYM_34975 [Streptomyces erythrochromogenes]|uniref:hypothetical protein n=1 Tax=Streptomyces erythrochromogenes TaxID=285574 RepID=UPI0036C744B3